MHQPPLKTFLFSLGAGYQSGSKAFGLFVVSGLILLLLTPSLIFAAAVTEVFESSEVLPAGTVVSVSREAAGQVERTNINNSAYVAGVVASEAEGLVALDSSTGQNYVAVSGDASILVATINGNIVKGDLVGPSNISGVAQKTTEGAGGKVLGIAMSDFDGTAGQAQTVNNQEVSIGLVPVRLLLTDMAATNQGDPSFISRIGIAVTGSEVSTVRVIISSLIFMTVLFVSGMMLFSSIRGTFDSIGRNPLASASIFSGLTRVTLLATVILMIGLAVAYLVMAV